MSQHLTTTHTRTRPSTDPRRTPQRRRVHGARRLLLLRAGLAAAFLALGVRLVFIQVVDHHHYAKLSLAQVRVDLTTTALRAGIYDRDGQILAVSRPTSLVIADDFQIAHPLREAEAMSSIVQVPVATLDKKLSERSGYVIVNDRLDLQDGHQLSTMDFPGIVVQSSSVRDYPNGPIATSVLGGTNAAGDGSAGLEYEYQDVLAGRTGVTREFV